MINKREIVTIAGAQSLLPNVVEKDYVLGWILAGIFQHEALTDAWVFKGGTCLKKCFFETDRFSEDLDFTLRDAGHLDAVFLGDVFSDIADWVYENTGIELLADRQEFDIYDNPRGNPSCRGKIPYRGPISPRGNNIPTSNLISRLTNIWRSNPSGFRSIIHIAILRMTACRLSHTPMKKHLPKSESACRAHAASRSL